MKFPYSQVYARDGLIFAARAGRIESFSVHTGNTISTWTHPDSGAFINQRTTLKAQVSNDPEANNSPAPEPPAKRQKTEDINAEEASASKSAGETAVQAETKVQEGAKGGSRNTQPQKVERPAIIQLTGTSDGKYVVAVSGQDKAIWVFEHDGKGQLTQLSKRVMPKRPSTVTIGPDLQILSADKFGDVYALPLIPGEFSAPSAPYLARRGAGAKQFAEPAATELTVHSKKNLRSLEIQKQQAELKRQQAEAGEASKNEGPKTEEPDFELSLLLGHVSMVTCMVLGENRGRTVILTGDRDEHVRVSRYIPQAHVIEGFCLGHTQFITSLAIPQTRGDILISGGGDEEVFVWNWQTGKLLSKTNLLSLVQEVSPDETKVAVSKMAVFDYHSESEGDVKTVIFAICEKIKAVFSWHLTEANELKFPSIIQVPGNPIDITTAQAQSATKLPSLVVAIDTSDAGEEEQGQTQSLNVYDLTINEGNVAVENVKPIVDGAVDLDDSNADIQATAEEIKRGLHGLENLRKTRFENADVDEAGEE